MGTGSSLFLAVGGVDFDTVGLILMVVGLLGMLFGLALFDNWQPNRTPDLDVAVEATGVPNQKSATRVA